MIIKSASIQRPPAPKPPVRREVSRAAALRRNDEFSAGRGRALRQQAAQSAPPPTPTPPSQAAYTVQAGDSYHRIAERRATELLAQQGLSPSDPSYSATWHRLAHRMVQDLMASNGSRPLHPGDQLLLPDPSKYGLVPGAPPVQPAPVTPPTTPTEPTVPPRTPEVPTDLGGVMVNQFVGDSDGRNANCGFASSLMALKALGVDSPALRGLSSDYERAMKLRALGGGGSNDRAWGTVSQVVKGLNAAGANASAVPNTWGSNKAAAVDVMRQAFLSGEATAFVVAGNPALGWKDQVSYDGGHFVTVASYDAKTDTFTVLDPVARQPFQVRPEQLAAYLKDGNAEAGELIQVRR
ncbi:MAG: hypothetical protein AB1938_21555 [Myxococcota bacterium]